MATAALRVQRDLRELQSDPVPCVVAAPIRGNLFAWSVTMVGAAGPYAGWPVHLHMTIPPDYPSCPPGVRMKSELPGHPNVFGDYICLDMIKVGGMGCAVLCRAVLTWPGWQQ
jgi:ubiquitin-conjugating enzyme E2 D/E